MSSTLDAFVRSWPSEPWLVASLLLSAGIYYRGWRILRRRDASRWSAWRLASFFGGLFAIFLALASPLEPFATLLLQIHMVQHLLLMMVAPPLIWLSAPMFPLVRGLPTAIRTVWVAPLLRSRPLQRLFSRLTHPLVAWPIYVGVTWFWHAPRFYEVALTDERWHLVEHVVFTAAALLFWYPVVRPHPSRPSWSPWLLFPYLLLADVQNTVLAAWLTFSSRVIYPHYENGPRIAGITALDDQAAAGVIMWVPGSIAFLLPLFIIALKLMRGTSPSPNRIRATRQTASPRRELSAAALLPILNQTAHLQSTNRFDLLRAPLLGALLRWRHSRPLLQTIVALLAVAVIVDGLLGPQVSPLNLAGVLPWIHWRGLVILGLLVAGNLFCMACPFTLPRSLARRFWQPTRRWPRVLKNKWLAVALVALFLWSYEAFALWDSPWLTAWIALAYFAAALVVDAFFAGASFCKYVCPIGQFNFVQSLASPLEVSVREPSVCTACTTKECIRGSATLPGCEMGLFQPRKAGNLDCTFCLDCVHVCPHENIGVLAVVPAATLWSDRFRAGVGRLSARPDVAALALVLVFGAFANAAGMVAPVLNWQDKLRATAGSASPLAMTTLFYALAIVALPTITVFLAAYFSRILSDGRTRTSALAARYAFALIPLGFAMWIAHYSFHFFTSWEAIIPAAQRFGGDLGVDFLGPPEWICACCRPAAAWVLRFEFLALGVGLLGTLYTVLRIAESRASCTRRAIGAAAPWGLLAIALYASGVWILLQPMQMRGTLPADAAVIAQNEAQP
ncbi:cytochrome c oxidase assembly protein [Lacipirellula limnantheis]|uniref:Cytochrome c oxidase caa3 assembly factor (Caa3_CtaG) n=1 Tax=Lacipirellula limnantheis TaxID=2528024 RepID=A0A517U4Q6_9BACT|nr:cytochrome c oxidase assembly protein [Lacipirellula limnantheis]QDT75598.1 Cytochrome c oxidase caa3 assembly factor (Caa3_CtaG) [Lacipirellula limnantheis]